MIMPLDENRDLICSMFSDDELDSSEIKLVEKALSELGDMREDYRKLLVLRYTRNLPYKNIADRLDLSVSAIGEDLCHARKLLGKRLFTERISPQENQPE